MQKHEHSYAFYENIRECIKRRKKFINRVEENNYAVWERSVGVHTLLQVTVQFTEVDLRCSHPN